MTPNGPCPRIDGCSSTSAGKKCCPLGGSGKFLLFVKTLSDGRNKCRVCPALPVTCMVLENLAPLTLPVCTLVVETAVKYFILIAEKSDTVQKVT